MLEEINLHERDKDISFKEEGHIYNVKGDTKYTSVTTLVHRLFPYFNENLIIDKMMKSPNWENNKYYGNTKEEIKNLWAINRIEAATLGTNLHKYIEDKYNQVEFSEKQKRVCETNIEYSYFKTFYEDHKDMTPYRTEWMVYDEEYKLSGSIDMTYINEDGTISIYDWKRCKKIEKDNKYNKFAKYPNMDLDDTNYIHYSIQLNIYKYILEKNYGKTIKDMYLICLHPENENKSYIKEEVFDMTPKINEILEQHKNKLK